jgi:hypothetical protein
MAEAEFIFNCRIELVKVTRTPFILIIRSIKFYFLTTYIKLVWIIQCYEVNRHNFISVPEKYSINQTCIFIISNCLIPIFNLEWSNLNINKIYLIFILLTLHYKLFNWVCRSQLLSVQNCDCILVTDDQDVKWKIFI